MFTQIASITRALPISRARKTHRKLSHDRQEFLARKRDTLYPRVKGKNRANGPILLTLTLTEWEGGKGSGGRRERASEEQAVAREESSANPRAHAPVSDTPKQSSARFILSAFENFPLTKTAQFCFCFFFCALSEE